MMILLVALVWIPTTVHCSLESVPGLEFLRCAEPAAAGPCEEDGHGCNNACCSVEYSEYQLQRQEALMPAFVGGMQPPALLMPSELGFSGKPAIHLLPTSPPELPKTWQFVSRSAPPVRAPSLIAS